MPLLLGWCEATSQARLQTAALAALLQAECQTWPRMAAHAGVVWRVLRRVHASAPSSEAPAVANLALDCGQELWRGGGPDFQLQLMTAKDSAADELLQVGGSADPSSLYGWLIGWRRLGLCWVSSSSPNTPPLLFVLCRQ